MVVMVVVSLSASGVDGALVVQPLQPPTASPQPPRPFYCVKCVLQSKRCKPEIALACNLCVSETPRHFQPAVCRAAVCLYCAKPMHVARPACVDPAVRAYCTGFVDPSDSDGEVAGQQVRGEEAVEERCAWDAGVGGSSVVVPVTALPPAPAKKSAWTPVTRAGRTGLAYTPPKWHTSGLPLNQSRLCMPVRAPMYGDYHVNAVTRGATARSLYMRASEGFRDEAEKTWTRVVAPSNLGVSYPSGGGGLRGNANGDDLEPLLMWDVDAGQVFWMCVAGADEPFELFAVVVGRCDNFLCYSSVTYDIQDLAISTCENDPVDV